MPYVDFESEDGYVSIFYTTNSTFGNVGGFDAEKPTVLMLHPVFLDSSWLAPQFSDPRLTDNFNLIALDMRMSGKSRSKGTPKHDSWVDAADLAYFHLALGLPPCHILAFENTAVCCSLRFAVLFPDMCLSLALCNVPPPIEQQWVTQQTAEMLNQWCYSKDLEEFEHVGMEASQFLMGPECDEDLRDELIEFWETTMGPRQRLRILQTINVAINRVPLPHGVLKAIKHPVLIFHGDRHETCTKLWAEKLASLLANVEGGAVIYTVKGGCGVMSLVPGQASIIHQIFAKFVTRVPHVQHKLHAPKTEKSIERRMAAALETLGEGLGDSTVATRNPLSSLSFSCLKSQVVKEQMDSLDSYRKGVTSAYQPVGEDGRAVRKYSERAADHWYLATKNGVSTVGTLAKPNGKKSHLPKEAPTDSTHNGRLRRATLTVSPNSAEKPVIKSSMAKVVSGSNSLQRYLKQG